MTISTIRQIAAYFGWRLHHLTQVATISCGHDFQLFADMRLAAWQQHAASNGKIEGPRIVDPTFWSRHSAHRQKHYM